MSLLVLSTEMIGLTGLVQSTPIGNNFADILTLLNGNMRAINLHDNAGIRGSQIVDRFNTYQVEKTLVPVALDATWDGSPTLATVTSQYTSDLYRLKSKIRTKNGQLKLLCAIDVWVESLVTADYFIDIRRNGTALTTGSNFPIPAADADNLFYEIANPNPLDNPFAAFSDGDILEYRFGLEGAPGSCTVRGVHITEHWKSELTS